MDWILPALFLAVIAAFIFLRQRGSVSVEDARRHLREGALLVDVRTPGEFQAGHAAGAVNVPLSELPEAMSRQAPDKNRVLLLHCQSGGRSGVAAMKLRSAGYTRVFNVGSLAKAMAVTAQVER